MGEPSDSAADSVAAWTLDPTGISVTQCRVDHAFSLLLSDGPRSFLLRIDEDFVVLLGTQRHRVSPGGTPDDQVVPALTLLHRDVDSLTAHPDGRLTASFSGGASIEVGGGTDYEAWTLTGPDGLMIVSVPGGGLAMWPSERSK